MKEFIPEIEDLPAQSMADLVEEWQKFWDNSASPPEVEEFMEADGYEILDGILGLDAWDYGDMPVRMHDEIMDLRDDVIDFLDAAADNDFAAPGRRWGGRT